ncbi:unannotated protein [freshwater metagenome]|uniref:Unannotated protein n=1 Tax=freshwater metagenome TaxID=449393 RepID=A0A6J6X8D3_9ZZZZ
MTDYVGQEHTEITGSHGSIRGEESGHEKFLQREVGPVDELFAIGRLGESGAFPPAFVVVPENANKHCCAGTDGAMCCDKRSDHW